MFVFLVEGQSQFQYDSTGSVTNVISTGVSSPPDVTGAPEARNAVLGGSATISVAVAGAEVISYQWYLNGAAVENATNGTLYIANAAISNQGSYTVVVCNAYRCATSAVATLGPFTPTWIAQNSGDWFNPANWSPPVVPSGSNDINIPGFANVRLSSPVTISGTLTCDQTSFTGSLLTIASNGSMVVKGYSTISCPFNNTGLVKVQGAGLNLGPNWSNSGIMLATNCAMNFFGAGTNSGTLVVSDTGLNGDNPGFAIVNTGLLMIAGSVEGGAVNGAITNAGVVDVQAGFLLIPGGESSNGVFQTEAGATLEFDRSYTFESGTEFVGQGTNLLGGLGFTANGPVTISNVILQSGSFTLNGPVTMADDVLAGGTCTLNGLVTFSNSTLAGAILTGNGAIAGQLNWSGGSFDRFSTLTIATNGTLLLAGVEGSNYVINGALTNAGTFELASGNLQLMSGSCSASGGGPGELVNLAGATINLASGTAIERFCGSEVLINEGTVQMTGTTGYSAIYPSLQNSGLVDSQGFLYLLGGGSESGTFRTGPGATLYFGNSFTISSGTQFIGTGTNLVAGNSIELNGPVTIANALLTNGTCYLNGAVTFSNSTLAGASLTGNGSIAGELTWSGGSFDRFSTLTLATNGTLLLAGVNGSGCIINGALTNAGTLELASGNLQLISGSCSASGGGPGELINLPGGTINLAADVSILRYCGSEMLMNGGTLEKTGGTGTSTIFPTLINTGLLNAQTGTINLYQNYSVTGGSLEVGISGPATFGAINFGRSAPLSGLELTVNLENGFLPAISNTFPVVDYASATGTFTNLNLPAGFTWQTNYGSTNFTLTVLGSAPILKPILTTNGMPVGTTQLIVQFFGSTGTVYTVLTSTDLNLPVSSWTSLGAAVQLSNSVFQFTDTVSTNGGALFYTIRAH